MTEQKEGFPKGKYTFVGIDVDATGRRILDEVNFCLGIVIFFFFVSTHVEKTRGPLSNTVS